MWHPNSSFPETLLKASVNKRLEYFSNGFLLNHEILGNCRSEIQKSLFKNDQYQIINISGPTGAGKTELAKNTIKHAFEVSNSEGVSIALPAVYVEVPVLGGASFDWKGLYLRILEAMNAPPEHLMRSIKLPESPLHGRGYSERYRTEGQIRKALEQRIVDCRLKVIIFDEVQHLFKFSAKNTEKSLDILKSIANITGCQIVLIGTYESLRGISWSGQLARRTKNIHFHRYDWSTSKGRKGFSASYMGLLSHIPHELDSSIFLPSSVEELYRLSCGCIGVLKQTIERAFDDNNCESPLSFEEFKSHSPNINELIQMAREIKEGEDFFLEEPKENLDTLLGMSKELNNTKKPSPPNRSINKKRTKPGQRLPFRDKVGSDA